MDPNANLSEQERIIVRRRENDRKRRAGTLDEMDRYYAQGDRGRLAELRAALANWLRMGGFEPDWKAYPIAAKFYGK